MKWFETSYRRNLVDMHIEEWDESFMSKLSAEDYVNNLKLGKVKSAMIYAHSHIGLCNWPTKNGKMHPGLKGYDFIGDVTKKCRENNIDAQIYYSLIYDNYCYKNHPSWRMINVHGVGTKEKCDGSDHTPHRYGNICPNNLEYREYTKRQLTDLMESYTFVGFFLDMLFWPVVCYCECCKERFKKEAKKEIPTIINWDDPTWLEFQKCREDWMVEFAQNITDHIKAYDENLTVEHQFAPSVANWRPAVTEGISDASDYTGGDFYGGFLQQAFVCKFYKNISKKLPFIYHTSRCAPNLAFHTVTKTFEELSLHNFITLSNNGAFLFIDAIDPDGRINSFLYERMAKVFETSIPYEKYTGGNSIAEVMMYFPLRCKIQRNLNGTKVPSMGSMEHPLSADSIKIASNLRKNNYLFDVITERGLDKINAKVLIVPGIYHISDSDAEKMIKFVKEGGNLYIRGRFTNEKLQMAIGIKILGETKETITYMSPTKEGGELMVEYSALSPLTIPDVQCVIEAAKDVTVLAKTVLPYTMPGDTVKFASGWSNPPSRTEQGPAIIEKTIGKGRVIYAAGAVETAVHQSGINVFEKIMERFIKEPLIKSNAPSMVEIKLRNLSGRLILDIINEQEVTPVATFTDISIAVNVKGKKAEKAVVLNKDIELPVKMQGDYAEFTLPKLYLFEMIEII